MVEKRKSYQKVISDYAISKLFLGVVDPQFTTHNQIGGCKCTGRLLFVYTSNLSVLCSVCGKRYHLSVFAEDRTPQQKAYHKNKTGNIIYHQIDVATKKTTPVA